MRETEGGERDRRRGREKDKKKRGREREKGVWHGVRVIERGRANVMLHLQPFLEMVKTTDVVQM